MSTVGTRWYMLAEAALVLGVSVDTVRRRLKRNQIEGRLVHTQHGPTWEVCLGVVSTEGSRVAVGATQPAQGRAEGGTDGNTGPELVQLVVLVDRLQRENRELAGQVGFLSAQLVVATDRLAALMSSESVLDTSGAVDSPSSTVQVTRPWWRRWRLSAAAMGLAMVVLGSSCGIGNQTKHSAMCSLARQALNMWVVALSPVVEDVQRPLVQRAGADTWQHVANHLTVIEKTC